MTFYMHHKILFTLLATAAALPAGAWEPNLSDTSRVYDLDEVQIVRQSKEQYRLRQQPISSSMYSSIDLQNLGTRDLRELSSYVPNFVMPDYGSRYTSSIYVRGLGSRVNAPAVGIYVDGMPLMSKSAYNFHLYDLSRADILRGPQGTLYGLNTEGGVVRLYTKNPMTYQGTDVSLGWGSHGYQNYSVSHYNKVSDHFAFSLGGFFSARNGFFRNQYDGSRADKYQEAGGRIKLVYQPTWNWNISLLANYQYTDQNGFPYGMMHDDGTTDEPNTNYRNYYKRHMADAALNINYQGNHFEFNSTTSYQYINDDLLMDIDYLPESWMYMQQREVENALTQEFTFKSTRPVGGFWRWTIGAFGTLQWIRNDTPVHFEQDMDAFLGNTIQNAMYSAMVNSMAEKFLQAANGNMEAARQMAAAMIDRAGGVSMDVDLNTVPGLFHTPATNLGIYHESNFDITPQLVATIGLRYDYQHVSLDYKTSAAMTSIANVMGAQATVNLSSHLANKAHDDFNQLLPKIGLSYRFGKQNSNIYAVFSKGYRAGGYNIQMFSDILQTELQNNSSARGDMEITHTAEDYKNIENTISYRPETSWNYEIGSHLNLFNNRMHIDVAAFFMQVKNQQLSVMAGNYGFGRMMVNAGESESCGIELGINGKGLNNHLSYNLSYGFTHAVFTDYTDSISTNGTKKAVSYKNNYIPFVPMHTLSGSLDYTLGLSKTCSDFTLTIGINASAQGKTYWDEANTLSQKMYALLGAHARIDYKWLSVNLWGRNLTNTKYNTFAVESAATGTDYWFGQQGNPFHCGVDIKLHF